MNPITSPFRTFLATTLAVLAVASCNEPDATPTAPTTTSVAPVIDPGDGGTYAPIVKAADFVAVIDNPYLPLSAGASWHFVDGDTTIDVEVLEETRTVAGVTVTVVRDRVRTAGVIDEDTLDFFAQDRTGNVWYFGEEVTNYRDGKELDHEGSWVAGRGGAQPGIVMPAQPRPGDAFRQEFDPGEAEDMFEIVELDAEVSTPSGDYSDALKTRDWTPLEPDVVEEKFYVAGIGPVAAMKVQGGTGRELLESYVPGG